MSRRNTSFFTSFGRQGSQVQILSLRPCLPSKIKGLAKVMRGGFFPHVPLLSPVLWQKWETNGRLFCSPTAIILAAFIWTAGEMRPQEYVPIPNVVVDSERLVQVSYDTAHVGAAYIPDTIILRNDFCEQPMQQSLPVHEMVHHIQFMTGVDCKATDCESQAYEMQAKWLVMKGEQ